jgi:hypothetical protein
MSSFFVTSQNRNAVRRLLVSTGLPAADVRNWPTSKLGATLRELVTAGKVTAEHAVQACRIEDKDYEFVPAGEQPPVPAPSPPAILLTKDGDEHAAALAHAIALAVQAAVQAVPQGLDVDKVLEVIELDWKANRIGRIDAMIAEAGIRPAVVEIRTDGKSKKVEGRTHKEFETLVRIVNTRVQGRRLHAWLVGPSGSGKSYLAAQVAEAVELPFYSTGAIQSKYDLIGFVSPTGNEQTLRTPFRDAFEKGVCSRGMTATLPTRARSWRSMKRLATAVSHSLTSASRNMQTSWQWPALTRGATAQRPIMSAVTKSMPRRCRASCESKLITTKRWNAI